MRKIRNMAYLACGVMLGLGLASSRATAETLTVLAERSSNSFFVDGRPVTLDAYIIGGQNYVRLRDVGQVVGFNVFWDGAVQVESGKPYTGEAPTSAPQADSTTDYSAQANPIIFTGPYTRDAYNALREAMLYGRSSPVSMTRETRTAMEHTEAAMGSFPFYELESAGHGEYSYAAKKSKAYTEAAELCQGLLASLEGKSDEEKLYAFACEISERLEYKVDAWTSPNTLFATPEPHKGNCTSYAHNFKFLCDMAGIPCVFVHSDIHQWNEVFVGDRWYSVDVGGFDVSYTTGTVRPSVLHEQSDMQGKSYRQTDPLLTLVAKELLVPGSTVN